MVSASSPCGVVDDLRESLRRTPDRLNPPGLPGPLPDLQRAASETNPEFLFRLLSRIEDSFRTGQTMSACSAGLECRKDRQDSAPRWPASPLRTHGSVMLCLRTHFWRRSVTSEGWRVQWEVSPTGGRVRAL